MGLSINNLKIAIDAGYGPTLASQFQVSFSFPQALKTASSGFTSEDMSILCQSATLAGTQIATTDLPVYGPPIKMPYGLVYQDLNVSFLCTNTMAQRIVFEEWRRIIVDPTTNFVNYYDTYIGTVQVEKLSPLGNVVHSVLYEEAFPIAIQEQELASGNNEWLRLNVQFSYRRQRTRLDVQAASKSGFGGGFEEPPTPPGDVPNPGDVFQNTPGVKVPEFQP